jgi:hypothetical protein
LKHEGPTEAKMPYFLVTLCTNVTGAPLTVTASATVMAENVARKKLSGEEPLNNLAKWHSCCPSSREVVSLVVNGGARGMGARIKDRVRHRPISDKLGECLKVNKRGRDWKMYLKANRTLDSILKRQKLLETSCNQRLRAWTCFGEHFDNFAKCLAIDDIITKTKGILCWFKSLFNESFVICKIIKN